MAYSAHAEQFSASNKTQFRPAHGDVPTGWRKFDQIYSEIADATDTEVEFRPSALLGKLPTIARFADKVQGDIIAVVIRDMVLLPATVDRLVRVRGGVYKWECNMSDSVHA